MILVVICCLNLVCLPPKIIRTLFVNFGFFMFFHFFFFTENCLVLTVGGEGVGERCGPFSLQDELIWVY